MRKQKKKKKLVNRVHKSKKKKRNSGAFGGSKKKTKTQLYDFTSKVLEITQESSKPSRRKSGRNIVGQLMTGVFRSHPLNDFSWDLVRENHRKGKTTECRGIVIKEGFDSDKEFADFHIGVQGDWDIGLKSLYELMGKIDNDVDAHFSRLMLPSPPIDEIGKSKPTIYLSDGIGYVSDDETSMTIITKIKTERKHPETFIRMCESSSMDLFNDIDDSLESYMRKYKNVV